MKPVYDTETDEALHRATAAVTTALPEVADLIARARPGQLTEEQAVAELTSLVAVGGRTSPCAYRIWWFLRPTVAACPV